MDSYLIIAAAAFVLTVTRESHKESQLWMNSSNGWNVRGLVEGMKSGVM